MKTKMKYLLCTALAAMMLLAAAPAMAEEQKVVRVACGMNAALYLDANGNPAGIGLPYIRQLAWNKNWKLEYVEGSYNECLQMLYDGSIDLMFPVGAREDPEGKLAYSRYIGGYQQIGLFARKDADIYYDDYEHFDHKRVGISIGANSDILDEYAAEHGFTYELVSLNTTQDKIDALMNGDVDMISFSTLTPVPDGKLVAMLYQLPFYFCTSAANTEMIAEIDDSMERSMTVTPDIVTALYHDVLKGQTPSSLTREEHDKIQTSGTITFGVYGDRLPLAGVDAQGNCIGIYADLLRQIADLSGLNIELVPVTDSNQLYAAIDDGTADFVVGIQELRFSQANADNHLSSNHITDCTTTAVTLPGYALSSDAPVRVALTKDRIYLESNIQEWFPQATIRYFDSRSDCLLAVCGGQMDATFLDLWEYNYETKNARFADLIQWESYHIVSGPTIGATRQSDLELLSILEKTISRLPAADVTQMISANLNMNYAGYTLTDRIFSIRYPLIIGMVLFCVIAVGLIAYARTKHQYIKRLEEANQAKSDFLSRISHELRTPLNAVSGYAQIMESNIAEGKMTETAELSGLTSIKNSNEYLLAIINGLLDVHTADAGQMTLSLRSVPFGAYLKETLDMIRPEAAEKKLRFEAEGHIDETKCWEMDPVRVRQILMNLLHNAIKFTPEGGSIHFSIECEEKDGQAARFKCSVTDTGIGMSQTFMATKLFQAFSQEYAGVTSPYEGCGIGLSLSRRLSRMMDGDITCKSAVGQGSTFTFTFQAKPTKASSRRRKTSAPLPCDLQGVHILLCEDNVMNQDIEKQLFEKMGCLVDVAADGQIGCSMFAESAPFFYDLIIMDIRMPNMDGLEATRAIRAMDREDAAKVVIMALSANMSDENVQASLAAGMNEHLPKPLDVRAIHTKIIGYGLCKA